MYVWKIYDDKNPLASGNILVSLQVNGRTGWPELIFEGFKTDLLCVF